MTDELKPYNHKHPFRIRPCDDEWCIVTKDNEGYDITVAEDLSDPLAKWMCDALNAAWNARAGGAVDAVEVERLVDRLIKSASESGYALTKFGSNDPGFDLAIMDMQTARAALIEHVTGKGER